MGKNPTPPGRSKVRIFVVEADMAPGDLKELTVALSSAFRSAPTAHRLEGGAPTINVPALAAPVPDPDEPIDVEDTSEANPPGQGRLSAKPRKYRSPKAVVDLDMKAGGKPFADFVAEKGNPEAHAMRYLVASAWLAEFAKLPAITADHIYTCYKSVGWTFDIPDPGLNFRYWKKQGMGDSNAGQFTINHLGLSKVERLKPSS